MEIRDTQDEEKIEIANLSPEEMEKWTREIFVKAKCGNDFVPVEVFEWTIERMKLNYSRSTTEKQRRMSLVKVLHTKEVVEAGWDIVQGENEIEWNIAEVGATCILHDVARFEQALLESFSDEQTGFDHAKVGAFLIRQANWSKDLKDRMDMMEVAEAVKWHSNYAYPGTNKYAKLIRDADKLGLARFVEYHLRTMGYPDGKLEKEAIQQFLRKETVKRELMLNKVDVYLCWLAWKWDLNFETTKRRFVREGVEGWLEARIRDMDETGAKAVFG